MTNEYRELLLGCGHSREKRIIIPSNDPFSDKWVNLTTLDIDPECKPDIVFDLSTLADDWLPDPNFAEGDRYLAPNSFNEIHAYEVLEHCGAQGDYTLFFAQFREFWRVLKPDGYFCATVPDWKSIWAWGDPGHTRVINLGTLVFLSKSQYERQLGKTAMSDYRSLMGDMDFELVRHCTRGELFEFVLRAVK